jgi:TolB-like protein
MRTLLVIPLFALALPALAEKECSIAVLDLQGVGLPEDQAHVPKILTDTLATEVDHLSGCRVITQADIAQMLDYEAQKAACGGDDSVSCLSDIGGALGVGFVVGGTIGKLGTSFSLQAKYINIDTAEVLRRIEIDVDGEVVQLRAAAKRMAAQLLDKAPTEEPPPPPPEGSGGNGALFWSGAGLLVVGGLAAGVGSVGAAGADGVLNDPRASTADKDGAIESGPLFFFTAVGGAVVAVAGAALMGVGFGE